MNGRRVIYWGRVFCQTDIPNRYEGGVCWVWAKVRPAPYWWLRRVRLFLLLLWRRWDEQCTRMDWRTAWEVSRVALGFTPADLRKTNK